MVTCRLDQRSFDEFVKGLQELGHKINDPNLQLHRAKKFREYTIKAVSSGEIDLKALSGLTQAISGGTYGPIWKTGGVLREMGFKSTGKNTAEAGYWDDTTRMLPGKKITYAGWVRALHTGFRIPLKGDAGERVRWWFRKYHGIVFKESTEWLIVPPRPFVWKAYFDYVRTNKDVEAVDEFLRGLSNSPKTTSGAS
ncbi:MAG: hypothetical protein GY853_01845 [PVC group bacterium]|nr:hypothetical protein [PVC group bacterium]